LCDPAQVFQIFQILNHREYPQESQIRNRPSRQIRNRNSRMSQTQQAQPSTTAQVQRQNTRMAAPANTKTVPGATAQPVVGNHVVGGNPGGGNPGGGNPGGNPVVPPVNPRPQQPMLFFTNPYLGNINPNTSEGQKLYMKATAKIPDDERFDISIANARKFLDKMSRDTNQFGWESLVRMIPDSQNIPRNMLKDRKTLTEADLKRQVYITFGNHAAAPNAVVPAAYTIEMLDPANNPAHIAPFYRRVRREMIASGLMGYLKPADFEIMKNKESKYMWSGNGLEAFDGPTILWLLLGISNPSTRAGVSQLKADIRNATSEKFKHNVRELTDYLSSKYREILERGQHHDDFLYDIFNALETVPNPHFATRINNERQEWELGGTKTADDILSKALTLYNNSVSNNKWLTTDPKDAKIMALTTQMNELLAGRYTNNEAYTSNSDNGMKMQPKRFISIDPWRMVRKGASIEKDGKTWHWCPHHTVEGKYDGLYVTHKPEDHDEWQRKKDQNLEKKRALKGKPKTDPPAAAPTNGSKKLVINDKLKAALLTHSDMTGAQVEELLAEVDGDQDF